MRVKLCWRKSRRGSRGTRPYSAAQLLARIEDGDWIGSIQKRVDAAHARGITHYLLLQREDERFTHAALVPVDALVPIWIKQRDISAQVIGKGALKGVTKNHAMNGASPTIYVQEDRAPAIAAALWEHPGVVDLIALHPLGGGGGFGRSSNNKLVEQSAVAAVVQFYRERGWHVTSREGEYCGYDLECTKADQEEHVEVKGVSGSDLAFVLTHGEVSRARADPAFVLVVVTHALSAHPRLHRFSGADFLQHFELFCLQYRATPRSPEGHGSGAIPSDG